MSGWIEQLQVLPDFATDVDPEAALRFALDRAEKLTAQRDELRSALARLVACAPPFTAAPIGAPHSPARDRQVEHAHAHAVEVLERFRR